MEIKKELKPYIAIADMITETFGSNCEAVIHDLSQPENSVVYVSNSITGRAEGQSFNHLIRKVLLSPDFQGDRVSNYRFEVFDPDAPNKKRIIKSSSVLIRDDEENIIGMLCVNCDITEMLKMREIFETYLAEEKVTPPSEELPHDVMTIIDDLINSIIGTGNIKNLTRKRCVEIVKFMDEKGIFLVKGAIDKVADLMGVSRVTIYSYLDEAKGKR